MVDLIEWLPDTSAFTASRHGGHEFVGWGLDRVFWARLIDAVNQNSYITARASAGKKGRSLRPPKPVPTPFKKQKKKPKLTLVEFAKNLARRHR